MINGNLSKPMADFTSFNYKLEDISDDFRLILDKYKIVTEGSYAYRDHETGDVVLGLHDALGNCVNGILTVDKEGIPGCSVIDETDIEKNWVHLDGLLSFKEGKIDFGNGGWMRKTVITNLLQLGGVNYDFSVSGVAGVTQSRLQEAFAMRGNKRVFVVSHVEKNRKLSDKQLMMLGAARREYSIKIFSQD
jgi:hypothetical protein